MDTLKAIERLEAKEAMKACRELVHERALQVFMSGEMRAILAKHGKTPEEMANVLSPANISDLKDMTLALETLGRAVLLLCLMDKVNTEPEALDYVRELVNLMKKETTQSVVSVTQMNQGTIQAHGAEGAKALEAEVTDINKFLGVTRSAVGIRNSNGGRTEPVAGGNEEGVPGKTGNSS